MSVQEEARAPRPASKAPWLNAADAPQRPDGNANKAKISVLVEQRRALIAEVKELQSSMQKDPASVARDEKRNACRAKLSEIDAKRNVMRERRATQDAEIAKLRKKRSEIAESLREIQTQVGGFKSVSEIEQGRELLMRKMESSGGGLGAERRNQAVLQRLEEAKKQLYQLQPLTEAMKEVAEQETVLQQEYLAISEQIGIYNKEYDEEMQNKRALDKEAQSDNATRSATYKKRSEISAHIDEISQSIDALYAEHQKARAEYEAWAKEAREKYFAKQEEQRLQRRKEYEDRINAHKIAAKKERAVKRQNPYVMEISACSTLIQYLKQKKVMVAQDEEDRKKREAAAHFDASQVAPAGCVVLNEGKWAETKPLSKAAKKQQQQQQQKQKEKAAKANAEAAAAASRAAESKDRMLQHPEDKIRLFQMLEMEPALSLATIDEKIHQIEEKKGKYERYIQTGEPVLSSGDDEEEEEQEEEAIEQEATEQDADKETETKPDAAEKSETLAAVPEKSEETA